MKRRKKTLAGTRFPLGTGWGDLAFLAIRGPLGLPGRFFSEDRSTRPGGLGHSYVRWHHQFSWEPADEGFARAIDEGYTAPHGPSSPPLVAKDSPAVPGAYFFLGVSFQRGAADLAMQMKFCSAFAQGTWPVRIRTESPRGAVSSESSVSH